MSKKKEFHSTVEFFFFRHFPYLKFRHYFENLFLISTWRQKNLYKIRHFNSTLSKNAFFAAFWENLYKIFDINSTFHERNLYRFDIFFDIGTKSLLLSRKKKNSAVTGFFFGFPRRICRFILTCIPQATELFWPPIPQEKCFWRNF